MNLAAVSLLSDHPENRTWYRAADARYLTAAIATAHTAVIPSRSMIPSVRTPNSQLSTSRTARLSPCSRRKPSLARRRHRRSHSRPSGGLDRIDRASPARRRCRSFDLASQAHLVLSVQELTGDWRGYRNRSTRTNVSVPVGTAPTQALGKSIRGILADWKGW